MPKKIPDCPDKPTPAPPARRRYEIELMTPMFGGGAALGEIDSEFPIRPTAIRGHLRHWWRLICGQSLGEGMWQREEEIFGSTQFPSPVTVSVDPLAKPEQFDPSDDKLVDRFGPVAYALFASIESKHQVAREGFQFRLTVQVADDGELLRRRVAQNDQRRKAGQPTLASSIPPIADDLDKDERGNQSCLRSHGFVMSLQPRQGRQMVAQGVSPGKRVERES
ncbi:MAG: type III-B CRISPR module RAMP protein Cmr1 [Planctomycetaceae bacterium]